MGSSDRRLYPSISLSLSRNLNIKDYGLAGSYFLSAAHRSNESHKDSSYLMGLSSGLSIQKLKGPWSFSYSPVLSYNSFQFIEATSGAINKPWSLKHNIGLSYKLNSQFKLSFSNSYILVQNFKNRTEQYFALAQTLSYKIGKTIFALIGHSNSSSLFKPNYVDYNVELYGKESSVYFVALRWGF